MGGREKRWEERAVEQAKSAIEAMDRGGDECAFCGCVTFRTVQVTCDHCSADHQVCQTCALAVWQEGEQDGYRLASAA